MQPRNLKFFLYIILYANQISCYSVTQFSRKMRWYLVKIQSCTIAQINNFEILQVSIAFFSDIVWLRNLKFFLYINPYGYSMQTKFHVLRSQFLRKMRWLLEISIALFSDTVRPRNMKFFLYINPYGYSMQTKFHVPWSHSFWEKCDDILKKLKVAHSP